MWFSQTLKTALVILTVLGCGSASSEERADAGRKFTISADPAEAVLRVTIVGGMSKPRNTWSYTLYGDGRLLAQLVSRSVVVKEGTLDLTYNDLTSLVGLAVDHELFDTDPRQLQEELAKLSGEFSDGSLVTIEIRLKSYARGGAEFGPVERTFSVVEPQWLAESYPDGHPIQGLGKIVAQVRSVGEPLWRFNQEQVQ